METRSRKRLRLSTSPENNCRKEDEEQNISDSNPCWNSQSEHHQRSYNAESEINVLDIVKLYDAGEYTQEKLDQALSVQKSFIYFHWSTTLDRAIGFLYKCELTKVVDIRKTANNKCDCDDFDLMKYYKLAPKIFPQILAQLCPNITEFRKINLSNSSHVAFLDEYKKNIPKYSETGLDNIPKNKFAGYMEQFVHTMPHLIEMMISIIGVNSVKVMMEAFGCKQESTDSIFNLVKEFKIKIDDTKSTDEQRNQKIEETIALLVKCPNTKTVDISLVTKKYKVLTYESPIVKFFHSMPPSFTQAFAQLCPRIEQISNDGDLIFNTQLFESYARGTNGRCNLIHVNLSGYRNNSKMQRRQLQYYVNSCSKIKTLETSFDTCNFLIEGQSIEQNKNLLDKLKLVEEMKLESGYYYRLDYIASIKQFLLMFTELKKLTLNLHYLSNTIVKKEIYTTINSLPSLTCVDLDVEYNTGLEFIRPSLIKKLTVGDMRFTRSEELNSITNLSNLQSLTLKTAHNNIIPFVKEVNVTILFNLKHIKIQRFTGDRKQLFYAAIPLSQKIRFDFECFRYEAINLHDVIRDIIDAKRTIFNTILLQYCGIIRNDHAILHEALTKLDSARVRNSFYLILIPESMKVVQRCELCQQLLDENRIFNILKI